MSEKKHVFELDELDSIAQDLKSLSTTSEQGRTRLQKIADRIRHLSDQIYIFYKKSLRSN